MNMAMATPTRICTAYKIPPRIERLGYLRSPWPPFHVAISTTRDSFRFPLKIEAREPTRKESAKVRNRRLRKKFNGTAQKPRLSIFCSSKHLYAQLVDDSKKKTLAFASTAQESIHGNQPCNTVDAARHVGEEIIKACIEQDISQVTLDRNGFAQGKKMSAFEIPIRQHGFLH